MHFLETQRERILGLIIEIEGTAVSKGTEVALKAGRHNAKVRLETVAGARVSA